VPRDGAVVARALEESVSVPEALELYQRARVERCARVVLESAEHGTLYHLNDPAQMKNAFAQRNIANERAQWLFNYDPPKVPLQDEDLPL
jgi:2-polyprenyl-6-methoxyphenol hydroxylase-like FAD-dependent oxidoreductase